jgi:hypothetical protein
MRNFLINKIVCHIIVHEDYKNTKKRYINEEKTCNLAQNSIHKTVT